MNRFFSTTALVLLGLCLPNISALGQMPELPEATKAHKVLHNDAGTWDAKIKMFMPGTDEPMESKGVETNEVICNGLWVRSHFKGDFMGMKFEGAGMTGYNPDSEKYVGYWGDNMSNHPSTLEGEFDADSNTFTYMVKSIDPNTGEASEAKHVIEWKDDNTKVFSIFMGDAKLMEIDYTKRAGAGSSSR